jgi:hypothetical protein
VAFIDAVRACSEDLSTWIDGLPVSGPDLSFPDAEELPDALLDLAVPHADINEIVAVARAAPEVAELRDRLAWAVLDGLGAPFSGNLDVRVLPARLGPAARLLYVYVVVAVAPHTRGYHLSRGIDPEVTRHSLADVGRQLTKHRRRHGVPGVRSPSWLSTALRGQLFQLGRLQFQRARLGGSTGRAVAAAGGLAGPGDLSLELHIPDFRGPLSPAACDRSIDAAHAFFAAHFPEETYPVAACHSWLLDRQLAAHLPGHAHIPAFQRRFTPAYPVTEPSDDTVLEFVFDDPALPLDELPRDTTLRRVVVDHLRAGGHWYDGNGWFAW